MRRITAEELRYEARLTEFIERARYKLEASKKRPLDQRELDNFELWADSIEGQAWHDFYGPPV